MKHVGIVLYLIIAFTFAGIPANAATVEKLGNGHVEADSAQGYSTDGWGCFAPAASCGMGSCAPVEGGAEGTAYAMQYTPGSEYGSLVFNLGPAIIKDEEKGYYGEGSGMYQITFWAKLEDTAAVDTADFHMMLHADYHVETGSLTYQGIGDITMTKQWHKFQLNAIISPAFLKVLQTYDQQGHPDAYRLELRFDGSAGVFKNLSSVERTCVSYLVDEVAISAPGTKNAPPVAGQKLTFIKDMDFICNSSWQFVTEDMIQDHTITFKVTVGNAGNEPISLTASLDVMDTVNNLWLPVRGIKRETYTLPPQTYHEFTIQATDATMVNNVSCGYETYFMRFDGAIKDGSQLIISGLPDMQLASIYTAGAESESLSVLPNWSKGAPVTEKADDAPMDSVVEICICTGALGLMLSVGAATSLFLLKKKKERSL